MKEHVNYSLHLDEDPRVAVWLSTDKGGSKKELMEIYQNLEKDARSRGVHQMQACEVLEVLDCLA